MFYCVMTRFRWNIVRHQHPLLSFAVKAIALQFVESEEKNTQHKSMRFLYEVVLYSTFANSYGFSISIGNTSNYFFIVQAMTTSKTVELDEDLTGWGEWLVPPIGFAICDDIPQLPIECAHNHGACALNRGMQSRTLGYAVGMSGTDWQIKSWPAIVLRP